MAIQSLMILIQTNNFYFGTTQVYTNFYRHTVIILRIYILKVCGRPLQDD